MDPRRPDAQRLYPAHTPPPLMDRLIAEYLCWHRSVYASPSTLRDKVKKGINKKLHKML